MRVGLKNGATSELVTLASHEIDADSLLLKVDGKGLDFSFSYSINGKDWVVVKANVDCSKNGFVDGGRFTGMLVGMYASSNGQPSKNHADFDWFDYRKAHNDSTHPVPTRPAL